MNPRELVLAALHGDDLTARQFVKDAAREGFSWTTAPAPESLDAQERAVHASLVELMATRANQPAPGWTSAVGPSPSPVFLVQHAQTSAAFRRDSLENTPEPLKKRNVFAVPRRSVSVAAKPSASRCRTCRMPPPAGSGPVATFRANLAVGRLDGSSRLLPDLNLFLYMYVRKEAVLSSQIEGTQSSLSDLLLFEDARVPAVPVDDIAEVSRYVRALDRGVRRLGKVNATCSFANCETSCSAACREWVLASAHEPTASLALHRTIPCALMCSRRHFAFDRNRIRGRVAAAAEVRQDCLPGGTSASFPLKCGIGSRGTRKVAGATFGFGRSPRDRLGPRLDSEAVRAKHPSLRRNRDASWHLREALSKLVALPSVRSARGEGSR